MQPGQHDEADPNARVLIPARPLGPDREPARLSVSDTGRDLAEKAGTAMYENDPDDRFEAALRLAEVDPA
jgi:hypothetical protein